MAVKQQQEEDDGGPKPMVEINNLKFTYPGIDGHHPPGSTPLIQDFCLTLYPGDRCLLVGSNGAGKHMVEPEMVRVLGRSEFHDTALTVSGDLCYLGGEVLGVDLSWRMHKVSDGQRRRVQICLCCSWEIAISNAVEKVREMSQLSLMRTVETWLRKERDEDRERRKERKQKVFLSSRAKLRAVW
ncbi:OLC1v1002109C2 [Oldenlandia corymbosa var. corymbosa]|uniref:OLC1v1002109C2 n=1 Tax=Oldenlandia corymbosa var. corymbosa TaxID=529605 RepID=A0AAV1D6U2_OLDCO|nr:OLC1v1002109C2 [Oldenlandia corymbosa var. corymbosa]